MAQSALTVTPPNPTPPTNFGAGIANAGPTTPPPSTAFADSVYGSVTPGGDPWHPGKAPNTVPPYLDDGAASAAAAFAAPASGTAAEGAGSETVVTQTYAASVLVPGSAASYQPTGQTPAWAAGDPGGPLRTLSDLGSFTGPANSPNASHASSLSPATNPALTNITPGSSVSGVGTTTLAAVGTNFTRQSVIYVNGVAQVTTYTSPTNINAASVTKKATAGTWPVTVVTGGAVTTAAVNWTFT